MCCPQVSGREDVDRNTSRSTETQRDPPWSTEAEGKDMGWTRWEAAELPGGLGLPGGLAPSSCHPSETGIHVGVRAQRKTGRNEVDLVTRRTSLSW